MPFNSNTAQGTVVYSSPTWETKILANDGTTLSSATVATVSELDIPIAKYERIIGDLVLWYDTDDTNDLDMRIVNFDSTGTQIATVLRYAAQGVVGGDALSNQEAATAPSISVASTTTTGTGDQIGFRSEVDGDAFVRVNFSALSNAGTNGTLHFQFANSSGSAAGTHLLAGSYITYKRF
tara:strand:+ start:75 stop:614 length:540 start_codon:yes stop_codon:yes gene_type:complete